MTQTQLASMFLGNPLIHDAQDRLRGISSILSAQIHIMDGQTHEILDYITAKNIIEDNHKRSLEDTLETYDFITFANREYAQYLEKRNRIIIPDEDNTLREFVIFEASKYRDSEGYKAQVFAHASYLELKKARIIYPDTFEGNASQHAGRSLNDTGWQVGLVEVSGTRTLAIENHTNPYEFLRRIAREFDAELRFRVEHNGNKIIGRYVDLLERVGEWRGREVEFGKDLDGIRRKEKQDIVTALLGIGPEDEEGNRIEVLVEDDDALRRWGRIDEHGNLHHLIEPYEIQSERTDMTESEAEQYTRTALNKRINTQVNYEAMIIDLENVPGMENKKIRFGDTIRIKDTHFNPPLYLEARVFEQNRSIKSRAKKEIKLGDFIEYTEDEINVIWNQLRNQIRDRITAKELADYTYNKQTIDDKDEGVRTDVESYANTVSSDAKDEAITYTNNTVEPILISVGNIEEDVEDIEGELSNHDTLITDAYTEISQAWDEIELKASQTDMDDANQRISSAEGSISTLAGEVELKASQTYVDAIEGRLETAEGTLEVLPGEINLKADADDVYTKTEIDASFSAIEGQIEFKIDDGEARSIFLQEADSFTFGADQINFDGHVFGEDATFTGHLEGATGSFSGNLTGSWFEGGWLTLSGDETNDEYEAIIDNTGISLVERDSTGTLEELLIYSNRISFEMPVYRPDRDDFFTFDIEESHFLGSVILPDSDGIHDGIEFYGENFIGTQRSDNNSFAIYGNRSGSAKPFKVRSHTGDDSGYRDDFWIAPGGETVIGDRLVSPETHEVTTSSNANMYVASNGYFARSSSAEKYKQDIEVADVDYTKIRNLQPHSWYDKGEVERNNGSTNGLKRYYGAIAEDFERIGLPEYLVLNEETGETENFNDRAWILLIPNINDIFDELTDIKQRLDVIESGGN